jgi:hypothetical protein
VNRSKNVNTEPITSPLELERQLSDQFAKILAEVPAFGAWERTMHGGPVDLGFDFSVSAQAPNGPRLEFVVECKMSPRPVHFPHVNIEREFRDQLPNRIRVPVLAAPVIGSRMAEVCWENGWSWFDLTGNCRLCVPGYLYIERKGGKPTYRRPRVGANLGTPQASRVLRVILQPYQLSSFLKQRDLQERCRPGVSLGLVNKVLSHLRAEKYVQEDKQGGYRVSDAAGLLQAWQAAYQFKRVRQLRLFTLKRPIEIEQALQGIGPHLDVKVAYAAFSAADLQAPAVRQPKTWLMVSPDWEHEVLNALGAKSVDSGENLIVLVPPDDGPFFEAERREGRFACTHPLQTYLDVSQFSGRGEEAAEALFQQVIKPAWKERGVT